MTKLTPIHPGEILKEEFLKPYGLSARAFAKQIGVPANRVTRILKGTTSITADTALRLAKALRTTPEFWMNLQTHYHLQMAADAPPQLDTIWPVEVSV